VITLLDAAAQRVRQGSAGRGVSDGGFDSDVTIPLGGSATLEGHLQLPDASHLDG
jgi:hypothetical protein